MEMIYSEILKRDNDILEDFCKLYILLGLSKFFLPTRMGLVHDGMFHIVNDLDKLGTYNSGGLVYEILDDPRKYVVYPSEWLCLPVVGNMKHFCYC